MHSGNKCLFVKSPLRSLREQRGFATAAKAIVVTVGVAGAGLVATTHREPRLDVTSTSAAEAVASPGGTTRAAIDPDAELREWLREPQPPTF